MTTREELLIEFVNNLIKELKQLKIKLKESDNMSCEYLTCDGYCLGNPGKGGYRVTDNHGNLLLSHEFDFECTNNFAELAALYAACEYIDTNKTCGKIYVDSMNTIYWLKNMNPKTKYNKEQILEMLLKTNALISKNNIEVIKWDTASLGEIPADAGNKK